MAPAWYSSNASCLISSLSSAPSKASTPPASAKESTCRAGPCNVPPIGVLTDPVCDVRVRHGRFLLLKGFDLELVVGPLFCLFTEAGKASCFGFHSGWSEATILQIVQRHGSRDLREGLSPNRPAVIASCCWRLELRYQCDENCDQNRNHTSLVLVFTISSRRLVGTSFSHKQPDSIHIHSWVKVNCT